MTTATNGGTRSRGVTITLWVLQILLALAFIGAGLQKLIGTDVMVDLFDEIGAGQWLRYVVGLLEVAAAVGVCVPLLVAPAAAGIVLLMAGAVVTNLAVIDENPAMPLVILVIALVVLVLRRSELAELPARVRR